MAVFLVYFSLGLILVALAFIDLEHMLLPDSLTLGGALLGFVSLPLRETSLIEALIGAGVGFAIIYLPFDLGHRWLRGQPGMGLGDAKLTLLAGAWFGWRGAVFALFAGAVQATLVTLAVYLARGRIEEPAAVVEERRAFHEALERAEGEERRELERELHLDPVLAAPVAGLGKARVPFGPFLALATLEYALLENVALRELLDSLLFPGS
jgi:leader peptidase (prepilin peptidase)/N-methyltransferase